MVNKITSPITPLGEIDKINEVIDQVNTNTTDITGKQATLVSGTNIKTINNTSLLGSGNIDIQGGGSSYMPTVTISGSTWCRVYPADSTGYRWCEQGGLFTTKNTAAYETVNLLQTYKDTDYTALCSLSTTATTAYSQSAAAVYYTIANKTTSSFQMYGSPTQALREKSWFTAGYLPNS